MPETTAPRTTTTPKTRTRKLRFTRIRFVSSDLSITPNARVAVRIVLADGRKRFTAEADGVGGESVILRLAVEAAIEAVHSITDTAGHLQVVGLKLVHAFDGRVVLVCLNSTLWHGAKLLGAVPVRDSLEEAAALAVLAATNRLVEKAELASEPNGANGANAANGTEATQI